MCKSGAHNPSERLPCARVRSFHGPVYFENDFGAKGLNIFKIPQTSERNLQTEKRYFLPFRDNGLFPF